MKMTTNTLEIDPPHLDVNVSVGVTLCAYSCSFCISVQFVSVIKCSSKKLCLSLEIYIPVDVLLFSILFTAFRLLRSEN